MDKYIVQRLYLYIYIGRFALLNLQLKINVIKCSLWLCTNTSRQLWLITVHSSYTHAHTLSSRLQSVVQLEFNLLRRSCCAVGSLNLFRSLPLPVALPYDSLSLSLCRSQWFCSYFLLVLLLCMACGCVCVCASLRWLAWLTHSTHTHMRGAHSSSQRSSYDKLFTIVLRFLISINKQKEVRRNRHEKSLQIKQTVNNANTQTYICMYVWSCWETHTLTHHICDAGVCECAWVSECIQCWASCVIDSHFRFIESSTAVIAPLVIFFLVTRYRYPGSCYSDCVVIGKCNG